MSQVRKAAKTAVDQCLGLSADESCAIVTDAKRLPIGQELYDVACEITDDAVLVRYEPGVEHGAEPPAPAAGAMRDSDTFLAPTSKSISHTRARSNATDAGSRGATLPGITEEVFLAGLDADYEQIAAECSRIATEVADADEIRVTSAQGTDITFSVGHQSWRQDTGIVKEPGSFSNLPAGEVFISPESATGTYVVDGTIRPHGLLGPDHRVTVTVEDGYATEIDDEDVAASFEQAAASVGQDAYNVAELGIGTNTAVTELVGSVLLDEKAGGTVHIALGDDASIGGDTEAPIHADGVLREPTVFVDGEELTLPSA